MPELPEVETIRAGLSQLLPGKTIKSEQHNWAKSFPNAESDVKRFLVAAKVKNVRRRAKVLIIDLSTDYSLVTHLKMTGQLVFIGRADKQSPVASRQLLVNTGDKRQRTNDNAQQERFGAGHPSDSLTGKLPDRSTRVVLEFTDGSKLFFNDQRKFGWMRLVPTAAIEQLDFFKKVGPEPLSADFLLEALTDKLARRPNSTIKAALLDQTVVAGIGNIYADEILWRAKIHPATMVGKLSKADITELFKATPEVLKLAIEKGGSTDRNYVNAEGKKGSYLDFANVFRREGQPCPRCGTTIIKTKVAARGTHICPHCQKQR